MIAPPIAAMAAFFLDTMAGDPQNRLHPVAFLGRFIGWMDRHLYPSHGGDGRKFAMGTLLVLMVLSISYAAAEGADPCRAASARGVGGGCSRNHPALFLHISTVTGKGGA